MFNAAVFAQVDELIVTESLIDALSLWCAGFRHVTAAYGTGGWTPEHAAAIEAYGIRRVLLAFDADEAGDRGALEVAQGLMASGVECFRVELPRGADVNDIAVQAGSPREALGRFLRKAAWMGAGPSPARDVYPVAHPVEFQAAATAAAGATVEATGAANPVAVQADPPAHGLMPEAGPLLAEPGSEPGGEQDIGSVVAAEVASPVPRPSGPRPVVEVVGSELRLRLGTRAWRVRGLERVTSFETLRVNVLVARTDQPEHAGAAAHAFHVDTLDLYSARARGVFVTQAAAELRLEAEVVKSDLGRVLLACEARAEEVIAAANEPAVTEVTVTGAARENALALLRDPRLIGRVEEAFAAVGMVGEAVNCLVGYLAAVSRKLPAPLAVMVQSTSAAGKSAVMEAVLGFVPEEDRVSFSAMTGQSLFYLGESDLAHKVLSVAEEEGASRAAYALKLLQSEGELSIASTGKDTASGRLVTHTYKVTGPTAIVLTTTAIDVDEELLNRCLVLTVDEDRAQTQAIHHAQRRAQTLDGLTRRSLREQVVAVHRDAQRLLEPLAVVNPYADRLTFADGRTRTRRDHGKYLGLIAAVTLLHQHQRPRRTATVNGLQVAYVESTIGDIEVANRLAHAVLGQSLDELAPQTRRLLTAIHQHVTAQAKELAVDVSLIRFTRRQLREALNSNGSGWGDTQLKVHLARLLDLELLHVHRGRVHVRADLAWRRRARAALPRRTDRPRFPYLRRKPVGPAGGSVGGWSAPGRGPVGHWSGRHRRGRAGR